MTSSLVGSEMCIRDRFRDIVHEKTFCIALPCQWSSAMGCTVLCPWQGSICLLYTSDAADDM
eukprot:248997-Prorocentrum_lima.AAC.1